MRKLLSTIFILTISLGAYSQENHSCSEGKILRQQKIAKKTRAGQYANSLLDKYDVHFYFLDINAERNNTIVSGATTIGAKVTAASLDTFCFELNSSMTIDSVVYNNQQLAVSSAGSIRYAKFASPQPINTNMYVKIYYNGDAHVVGGAAIGDGFSTGVSGAWGNECTWSLSEPYSAYEWFPCKQFLQDKADSAWIFVTTSDENKVGSNGLLEGIDVLPNNKVKYRWKTHYIIDYYLISVAIAKYVDYTIYAHPTAMMGDSVPIVNYVYDNPQTLPTFKSKIDSNIMVLEYYSDIMGLYPFHAEKYGHCMAPFGGGMEHQTMTSIGNLGSFSVNCHELFHQWWGDHVTCKTWKDIFINEGFASYGEYLAYDKFRGYQAAQNKMQSVHDNVLQDSFAMVYFTDTNNVGRIFSKRLTYDKGSAVIHTLRFVMGDSLFFKGLKEFQSAFSFGTAGINDLHILLETISNMSLYDYFHQWLYGEGYPVYSGEYFSDGTNMYLKITHVTSSPVTPVFKTPLEIKCLSASGDTTIRVNINQNTNTFIIPCSKIITGLEFDPNNWLLNEDDLVVENPALISLSVANTVMENNTLIYPNPSADEVTIENKSISNGTITLRDLNGSILHHGVLNQKATLHLSHLASGVYFVEVVSPRGKVSRKLSKY